MKVYDLVKHKSCDTIGIIISIKEKQGLIKYAYWIMWSDGDISWTTENRIEVLNESRGLSKGYKK